MQRRRHTPSGPEEQVEPSVPEAAADSPSGPPGRGPRPPVDAEPAPAPSGGAVAEDGAPEEAPAPAATPVSDAIAVAEPDAPATTPLPGTVGALDGEDAEEEGLFHGRSVLKHIVVGTAILLGIVIAFRLLAPHISWIGDTWEKVRQGDPKWLIAGVLLEVLSFAGYVAVLSATAERSGLRLPRITAWRITLAGVAATRLLATAGAGGIAATAFALRRNGLDARAAGATVAAQLALVYAWFVLLILITGLALFLVGHASPSLTIVPAGIAAAVLLVAVLGRGGLRRLAKVSAKREGRMAEALAAIPGTLDDGVRSVVTLVRERDPAVVGAALWWIADAGVLWVACHAFGASPNMLDVLMAYLLGQLANLLPIPGGLGVEAGLLGMLIAFGVSSPVALLASLTQRLISTWLPALPGAIALVAIGKASQHAEIVDPGGGRSPAAGRS